MKKVLHVITDSGIGGAGILVLRLLQYLDRTRYIPVLALPRGSLLTDRARELGVRTVELDMTGDRSFSPFDIPVFIRLLREERPDILHTHASLTARFAALLCPVPALFDTKHCAFAPSRLARSLPARLAVRALDGITDTCHIATAEAAVRVLHEKGIAKERIRLIVGGSEPILPLAEDERRAMRASLGLCDGDFAVGYAARLEKGKGHEDLIDAARLLRKQPHVKILLVGGGSREEELKRLAAGLPNVRFIGFRSDMERITPCFDMAINCSYLSETSSLSLSESMSLGLPIVVTACGGNPDMARDCGIVIPPRDPRAIADAVTVLARDQERYAILSKAAERRFRECYTAQSMTYATMRAYEGEKKP